MISALAWVPRGAAKAVPVLAEVNEEELARAKAELEAKLELAEEEEPSEEEEESEDEGTAVERAKSAAAAITSAGEPQQATTSNTEAIESAMRELDMDHYDDSDDEEGNLMARVLNSSKAEVMVDEEGDPYITLQGEDPEEVEEKEDYTIKPTDLLILAARNEDDVSNLEVWLYEEGSANEEANIYVHHDILIPAFPLCLAWLDCDPTGKQERANMVAIGTMEPGIEIWDVDVIDAVEPVATLGGLDKAELVSSSAGGAGDKKKKKKKKSKAKLAPGSHEDAVLGLSWNRQYRNVLASASADHTVKVWDLSRQVCEHTLTHHTSKVQAVAWNPVESPVLLTGAFDKTACLIDVRTPEAPALRWPVTADVEALTWHPHDPTCFLVSSEDGIVAAFDARKGAGSSSLFRLCAHDKPTCTMSFCPLVPNLLATASTDKRVKLWDVTNHQPTLVAQEDLQVGAVFGCSFCADAPYLLAAGGAKGSVTVWDLRHTLGSRYPQLQLPAAA